MKAELQDHKTEERLAEETVVRHKCKDAVWVQCPWNAIELGLYCGKPDVECEHRGGLSYSLHQVPVLVDLEETSEEDEL